MHTHTHIIHYTCMYCGYHIYVTKLHWKLEQILMMEQVSFEGLGCESVAQVTAKRNSECGPKCPPRPGTKGCSVARGKPKYGTATLELG